MPLHGWLDARRHGYRAVLKRTAHDEALLRRRRARHIRPAPEAIHVSARSSPHRHFDFQDDIFVPRPAVPSVGRRDHRELKMFTPLLVAMLAGGI